MRNSTLEENKYDESGSNGRYEFSNISSGDSYDVEPQDDKATCLSGVSTADVVKIQKHILGIKNFDSPYQYLAADANQSKSISAADILAIRKLILGAYDAFPNNKCWLYVDAKQQLSINNPYNYKSKLIFTDMISSVNDADFKVVKVGDINDNHIPQQMPGGLEFRNADYAVIELGDVDYQSGNTVKVPVYIKSNSGIEGMQFTINFPQDILRYETMENGQIDINEYNTGLNYLKEGKISFSWNTSENIELDYNQPAFYMIFDAKNTGNVSRDIRISSDITAALSVIDDNEAGLRVLYRNSDSNKEFAVYQNTPNPFKNETTVKFNLPEKGMVELSVYDITGKQVYKLSKEFDKGLSQLIIKHSDVKSKGIFYYTLKTKDNTATKKMILIE
jgi:hypothetical protein